MPVTPAKVAELLAPLEAVRAITSRKMFGGIGIYSDGVFFAVIDDDRLYFKVGESNEAEYERFGAEQWVIEGEKPAPMPYRQVPKEILMEAGALGEWIDAAVQVALTKKRKK